MTTALATGGRRWAEWAARRDLAAAAVAARRRVATMPRLRRPADPGADMITRSLVALFVGASLAAFARTSGGAAPPVRPAADPEPPPRLAGEVVKVEVTRYT